MVLAFASVCLILGLWVVYLRKRNRALFYLTTIKNQERDAVLTFLNQIGEAFTREINLDESLSMIGEFIVEETSAESGAIYLLDDSGQTLSARVVVGLFPPMHETLSIVATRKKYLQQKVKSERIALGEGIIGLAAETGKAYLIPHVPADSRVQSAAHSVVPMKSLMITPLRVRGKILGVMAVLNKTGDVGEAFNEEDMGMLQALSDQAAVTVNMVALYSEIAEKQRIQQEIQLAREFQRLLLPKENPVASGWDFSGVSTPALEVGGDYYDFIQIDDERLGICIADVSGKGIPGGLVMAAARSTLQAVARIVDSPADVLSALNERIVADTGANVFVTMTYGILNLQSGEFNFARAGHEPTLIIDSDGQKEIEQHSPDGIALGLVDADIFSVTENCSVTLEEGQSILLYTDGVIEAMNKGGDEYGWERFQELLEANRKRLPGETIKSLLDDIKVFSEGIHQHDDITVVAFRRLAQGESPLESSEGMHKLSGLQTL